jgi:hypothetical protein
MRKFIITAASLAALAIPSAAMADQPTGYGFNANAPAGQDYLATGDVSGLTDGEFKGSLMGEYNSRATHVGIVLGGTGSRSEGVQAVHGLEGIGSQK